MARIEASQTEVPITMAVNRVGAAVEEALADVEGQAAARQVTITNASSAPIAFDVCPAYDEGFTPDALVSYVLNCGPVGRLDVGAARPSGSRFSRSQSGTRRPSAWSWSWSSSRSF